MKKMVLLCLMALAIGIEANAVPIMVKRLATGIAIEVSRRDNPGIKPYGGYPAIKPYRGFSGKVSEQSKETTLNTDSCKQRIEPVLTEEKRLIKEELGRDTPTALYLLGGMVGFALVMTLLMLYWDGNNMTIQRVKKAWLG